MKELMLTDPEPIGFLKTLIIPVFVTFALLYLLITGEKDKFYPAMPYLAVGCVLGYLAILLLLKNYPYVYSLNSNCFSTKNSILNDPSSIERSAFDPPTKII